MEKIIGYWLWNYDIPIVEIDGKKYALYGWNGEKYLHCWECKDTFTEVDGTEYEVKPIYAEDSNGEFEIVDYEVIYSA